MKTVRLSNSVQAFLKKLAPEPRKKIKEALRLLAKNQGDIKALENDLEGYYRLRVSNMRIIFCYNGNNIECVFAEFRSIVYEIFEQVLKNKLTENH